MLMMLIYSRPNVNTVKWNTEALVASKDIGLAVNAEKSNYVIKSRVQNAGQINNTEISNKSFARTGQLR